MIQADTTNATKALFSRQCFDKVSITFHWITLAFIINQFSTGWLLHADPLTRHAALLFVLHRCGGAAVWLITLCRLTWRRLFAYLPPFPPSMSRPQQLIASMNEYGLYGMLLIQPLTGLGQILSRGHPIHLLLGNVGPLPSASRGVAAALHECHEIGAILLAVLIGLHVSAALFHHLFLRDGVVHRMLPLAFFDSRSGASDAAPSGAIPLRTLWAPKERSLGQ